MRFDSLPIWAQTAILSGPIFGSEDPVTPVGDKPATVADPPADKPDSEKPIVVDPDEHLKTIRERDQTKAELAALQQEKTEREEADAQALAATRSKEENQDAQIKQLTEENSKLLAVNTQNLLDLAIFRNNKFEWNDPNVISKLIDQSDVKVDPKSGKVEGVDEALKTLAKDHPYLLKPKSDNGDGNGNSNGGNPLGTPAQASGGTPAGSRDSSAKANKRAELEKRFNVLRV